MAKAAEVEEKRKQSVAMIIKQERALEMQMQRLWIGNGNNLRVFKQCWHEMELESSGPGEKLCREALAAFEEGEYNTSFDDGDDYINKILNVGTRRTKNLLLSLRSFFPQALVSICVAGILDGNNRRPALCILCLLF